jgi:ATP/maltotriose-dependent transcriptional regulator MalT
LAAWLLGASYLFDGDTQHAEHYLAQAIRLCQEAGNIFITSVAIQELSNVRMEQGRYRQAYQLLQQALQEMSSEGRQAHPSLGYLYRMICLILFSWNQLEEAERALKQGMELMAQDIPGEMLIMSTSMLPYLKLAQGKREEALQLAEECLQRVEAYPLPYVPAMIKANLIRFWIRVAHQPGPPQPRPADPLGRAGSVAGRFRAFWTPGRAKHAG